MIWHLCPCDWANAARCAQSVVLPAPPLREATVMTFIEALPGSGYRMGTDSLARALGPNG